MAALMFGEFEFEPTNYCGYQWRNSEGEHMCFELLNHPRNGHFCECGQVPNGGDRGRA